MILSLSVSRSRLEFTLVKFLSTTSSLLFKVPNLMRTSLSRSSRLYFRRNKSHFNAEEHNQRETTANTAELIVSSLHEVILFRDHWQINHQKGFLAADCCSVAFYQGK